MTTAEINAAWVLIEGANEQGSTAIAIAALLLWFGELGLARRCPKPSLLRLASAVAGSFREPHL